MLESYKEAHARLGALEFRLVTVALFAKNVTRKKFEDKRDELLCDFFVAEGDHEMAYTDEEKRRIVSYMHSKMDEVEPAAFATGLASEAAMLRVMSQVGTASSANEVRSMIETADSYVDCPACSRVRRCTLHRFLRHSRTIRVCHSTYHVCQAARKAKNEVVCAFRAKTSDCTLHLRGRRRRRRSSPMSVFLSAFQNTKTYLALLLFECLLLPFFQVIKGYFSRL